MFSLWVMSSSFHYLLEFAQVHVRWVTDAIQPSYPLPPSSPPAFNLFQHWDLFQWIWKRMNLALPTRWPKYWSFSFSISPSDAHSGLISFRMDWFDLLAVQRTLNSLLQHHSSKAFWWQGLLKDDLVNVRSLGWALIQPRGCPEEQGKSGPRRAQRENHVKARGEDDRL